MRLTASGKGLPGTKRGTRPATPVSPDYPANKGGGDSERASVTRGGIGAVKITARQMNERASIAPLPDDSDANAGIEAEIEFTFRMKLSGIRRLPRREKIHAVRAARIWRTLALKALREQRAKERHARYLTRRLHKPEPV